MLKIGGQKVPSRTLLLVFSDLGLVLFGLLVAISIRFLYWSTIHSYLQQGNALFRIGIAMLACELALYYHDLYDPEAIRRHTELLVRLLQALGTACLALAILYYLFPDHSLGRGIAVLAAPIIFFLLLGWRLLMERWGFLLWEPRRVLVLGTGPVGISFVREILARPELKIKIVGFLDENRENIGKPLVNPGIIGAVEDVQEVAAREKIDCVILSLAERRGNTPVRQLLDLKFAGIAVEDAHSIWEEISGRIRVQHLSPSWLILSEGFRKPKLLVACKRAVDFIAALVGLIVSSPIMLGTVIAIWIETGGPILFRQERTGLHGLPFHILKFRSMDHDAEKHGPCWATDGDQRITRVGRIIRKLRFDELPQFINVLRGEMSLVGPRPERPIFCEMLEKEIPLYAQRYSVRPGITGWAQVKYQYGASVEEARTKLEYDLFYIKHMSILLDLAILFETGKVLLTGRGAK
jgi:sugar transferase (PEP-CTERM system associated)